MFNKDFFIGNRQALRQKIGDDRLIIITANGVLQRSGSVTFPFRQDSNFWYLTGINVPDLILVMYSDEEFLVQPLKEGVYATFDGNADAADLTSYSGITDIQFNWVALETLVKKANTIATCMPAPAYEADFQVYANPARAHLIERLSSWHEAVEYQDIRMDLARLRMIKQAPELIAIQSAIDISIEAASFIANNRSNLKTEYDIQNVMHTVFNKHRVVHAFEPITASGQNACTIHYLAATAKLKSNELFLIDFGAEVNNYSADISRTYPKTKATKRQQAIIDAVIDIQRYAYSQLKPGVTIRDNESLMEAYMGEKLVELGVIKKPEREAIRHYYPHATSHYLGLDTHDAGDYQVPLKPNMVITVEPGIYIPEEGIGVRIEDDVLITKNGLTVLSQNLPSDIG